MNEKDKDLVAQRFVTNAEDFDAILKSETVLEKMGDKIISPIQYKVKD